MNANYVMMQKTSTEMDSIWRMQVVRENASKRDIWKRCASLPRRCSSHRLSTD